MSIVGEAEIVAVLNTAGLKDELAATDLEGGLGAGAKDEGEAAGEDLRTGVKDGAEGIEGDLAIVGSNAGRNLHDGITDETGKLADDVGDDAEDAGKSLEDGVGGPLEGVKNLLGGLGVPESLLGGFALTSAAVAGVAAVAIDMGEKMQTADADIATSAGISVKAATAIGNAFLGTAGTTEFSGQQMAMAFSTVAGQLKATEGHALSTKESLDFMTQSTQLATAKGIDLATSTSTLAAVLQTFQQPVKDTANAANVLFNASNATGQGVDTLGAALDKMKAKLGAAAPSLGEMGGLLVDLTNHGETGRVALTAVNTGLTALLKPAEDMTTAQAKQNDAFASLPPTLKTLAKGYLDGSITSKQLESDTENLTGTQSTLFSAFTSSVTAVQTAKQAQTDLGITMTNSKGQILPMVDIIGQLHTQIKGMSDAQALAKLTQDGLGTSAKTLLTTIQAGPAAFQAATDSVTANNSVSDAAAVKGQTLGVQFETLKSTVVDFGTELGQELIPILEEVMQVVEALVPVIGTILKAAFAILTPIINTVVAVLKPLIATITDLINFVTDIFEGKWSAAWQAVGKLFSDAWDTIKTLVEKIPEMIFGPLGPAIIKIFEDAGTWLYDAGKDIIEGLINGVKDMASKAVDAVKDVGKDVEGGIKDVLGIFSPSTVMMGHGQNIVLGLAQGITAAAPQAVSAITQLGKDIGSTPLGSLGATLGSSTSAASGSAVSHTITVAPNAVVIQVTGSIDPSSESAVTQAINTALQQLANELASGVNPLGAVGA